MKTRKYYENIKFININQVGWMTKKKSKVFTYVCNGSIDDIDDQCSWLW